MTAPAGSAIICNSSMWHAGTRKKTDAPRRMLHLSYTRRDLPQQLVQLDYLTPELYDRMSPEHRYLLEIEPPKRGRRIVASRSGSTRAGGTEVLIGRALSGNEGWRSAARRCGPSPTGFQAARRWAWR